MDSLEDCIVSYDLKDILIVRELCDTENVDPKEKWETSMHYEVKNLPISSRHKNILFQAQSAEQQLAQCFTTQLDNYQI